MLFSKFKPNPSAPLTLQEQLYQNLRQAILSGEIPYRTKLPSIRQGCVLFGCSRTPIISAYDRLWIEGYIDSKKKSGYWVIYKVSHERAIKTNDPIVEPLNTIDPDDAKHPKDIRFDFGTNRIEHGLFDMTPWRRCLRKTLQQDHLIDAYGEPTGETALKQAITQYLSRVRDIKPQRDQVFIGAGVQALLYALLPIFKTRLNSSETEPHTVIIVFFNRTFKPAERIAHDFGYQTLVVQSFDALKALTNHSSTHDTRYILYMLPQAQGIGNGPLTIHDVQTLQSWLDDDPKRYIIEDDFNGELRYQHQPLPAIQSFISDRTLYMGSFSKTLMPALRIAYMVLPPSIYQTVVDHLVGLNASVSVIEQHALSLFIQNGWLDKQLKKIRKIYAQKSAIMQTELEQTFINRTQLYLSETELSFYLTQQFYIPRTTEFQQATTSSTGAHQIPTTQADTVMINLLEQSLADQFEQNGIRAKFKIHTINQPSTNPDEHSLQIKLQLAFSALPIESIYEAVQTLKNTFDHWEQIVLART